MVELAESYLKEIEKKNKDIHVYLEVFDDVVEQAKEAQKLFDTGKTTVLTGIPFAVKDNILIKGRRVGAASKILEGYHATYDATAIKKLKEQGAIFLGRTNMDEFAMGSSTENSAYGPTKNPHDTMRVPGGSSGGSAAAVAANMALAALGSDTGGSIRQPASFCGIVGLKPTYGRVSRHGLIAMTSSLDQIGPLTKNVYDAALVLNVISSKDKFDSTATNMDVPDFTKNLNREIRGMKIGVPKEYFGGGIEGEVREKIDSMISKLNNLGCKILDISLPHSEYALAAYYIINPSEVSSNLARFDGIRYGHSSKNAKILLDVYRESRAEGFGPEPKRRIMIGTYALSSGYYDAYYLKAQKIRALVKKDFDDAFSKVDVIIGPTTPSTAFKLGEKSSDPLSMYLSDIYTVPINLAGLPGISIPCGNGSESGLPVGFQIIGKLFDEETILRVAYQLEQLLTNN